jgi:tetratricopeptide (TPR) repeat protein
MQATIDGDFAKANLLLNTAQEYADEIDDLESKVTLPLQRFSILIEWDSPECGTLLQIESRLEQAYRSGMAEARFFVAPFIESHKVVVNAESARYVLDNSKIIERTFAGGDRYSPCRLGEFAAIANDAELAQRAFDAVSAYEHNCAILGLMGMSSSGPISWSMGRIAAGLGRHDEALSYLDRALGTAKSMRALPWRARIHATIAKVAGRAGQSSLAGEHAAEAKRLRKKLGLRETRFAPAEISADAIATGRDTNGFDIHREGELWRISFGNESTLLRPSKGLKILAALMARPDTDVHVIDLRGGRAETAQSDAGPSLDPQARREYESRLKDLRDELEEAQEFGDTGRADSARAEIDFITRELSRAFGLGGRARRSGDAAERARVNVRRRLKDAIARIAEQSPRAGRYLENTIKTGTYCRYTPM